MGANTAIDGPQLSGDYSLMIRAGLSPGPAYDPAKIYSLLQRPAVAALARPCPDVPIGICRCLLSDSGTGTLISSTPFLKVAAASSIFAPSGRRISRWKRPY